MNLSSLSFKHGFILSNLSFEVEIDYSVSASLHQQTSVDQNRKALHSHPFHEVFFVFDDSITLVLEDKTLEYKNSIICIPPYTKHFVYRTSDYRLLFSCKAKNKQSNEFSTFFLNCFAADEIFHIPVIKPDVKVYLDELCYLFYHQRNELAKDISISCLKMIFFHIFICKSKLQDDKQFNEGSRYFIINQFVSNSKYVGSDDTINALAERLNLSPKQTSRLIKNYYGKSFPEVIVEEKLDYAAYLLTSTNFSIAEVAYKCNFHSENYFYNLFKSKFGYTPLKYQKKNTDI